jgi:hypothetical protein
VAILLASSLFVRVPGGQALQITLDMGISHPSASVAVIGAIGDAVGWYCWS